MNKSQYYGRKSEFQIVALFLKSIFNGISIKLKVDVEKVKSLIFLLPTSSFDLIGRENSELNVSVKMFTVAIVIIVVAIACPWWWC